MDRTRPKLRNFAQRVIAIEAATDPTAGSVAATIKACEKLQVPLVKFVGVAGFYSLMSRALAMAKIEANSLRAVQVRRDGTLDGLDGAEDNWEGDAGVVLVTHLLGLLVTFIGEPMTLRLVSGAWPEDPLDQIDYSAEGES